MRAPRVVGLGRSWVDLLGLVPRLDGDHELAAVAMQPGGDVTVALLAAAALGADVRLATVAADDDLGRFLLRALASAGCDERHLRLVPGTLTPFRFAAIATSDRRMQRFHTRGDLAPLDLPDAELDQLLDGAAVLVVDGSEAASQTRAAEAARARGVTVVLDVRSLAGGLGELVPLADVCLASERFAGQVAPRGELEDALRELVRLGPRSCVITLGAGGAVGMAGGELVRQPAFAAEATETLGAGNVFTGAFATALAHALPFARALAVAAAAAAASLRELGRLAALPDVDDVAERLGVRPW